MDNTKYKVRKAKSNEMLAKGVELIIDGFNQYFTPSQTDSSIKYHITIKNGWYSCDCLDNETRFLLASNQSPTRSYEDARQTFQQAKSTAGKKALTVVTDGAFSYEKAVRKEFATYQNPKPHYRYVSLKQHDSNNNVIERFHESFR